MAIVVRDLQGGVTHYHKRYKIDANVVAGQLLIRSTATNSAGEVVDPTTTAAAHIIGVAPVAVTYTATAADLVTNQDIREGRTASVVCQPFAMYEFRVSGGTTSGTALNSTAPANILTTTDTSQTVIAAVEVGTVSHAGGTLFGVTGNNQGQSRRISAHSNSTSTTVEVPFRYAVAAGDVFIRLPYSLATRALTLTADFTQADGTTAITGAGLIPVRLLVDLIARAARIHVVAADHHYSALA